MAYVVRGLQDLGIIIFMLLLCSLALASPPARALPTVTGHFTCDNAYAVWVGDVNGVNSLATNSAGAPLQGVNTKAQQISAGESVTFDVPDDFKECYLYLIAWSDDVTYQGIIGSFDGTVQVGTGAPEWQVLHTNDDRDTPSNPLFQSWPVAQQNNPTTWLMPYTPPTAVQINAKIIAAAAAATVANGAGGTCDQGVWDANSGNASGKPCWTDPYLGPTNAAHTFPFNAFGGNNGINVVSPTAKWMWYDSTQGQAADGIPYWTPGVTNGHYHPFADDIDHGEYLIFRIPCDAFFQLNIDKQALGTPWQAGGAGTFQVTVTNNGDAIASGASIVVNDVNFPSPPLTVTSIGGSGWSCTPLTGPCTYTVLSSVAAGATLPPITVNVGIDSGYQGEPVQNCAEVTLQQAGPPVLQDSSCTDVLIQATGPQVSIEKHALNTPWQAGGTGTFQVTVNVLSNIPAGQSIAVHDALPGGFTLSGPVVGTPSGSWNCNTTSGTCYLNGPITAGTSASLTFSVHVPEKCDTYANCADIGLADAFVPGAVWPDFSSLGKSCVKVPVIGCGPCNPADLHIKKTHSPASFNNGGTGTIHITVNNNGTAPVIAPIQVNDSLPVGLTMPQGPFSPAADIACLAGPLSRRPLSRSIVHIWGTPVETSALICR